MKYLGLLLHGSFSLLNIWLSIFIAAVAALAPGYSSSTGALSPAAVLSEIQGGSGKPKTSSNVKLSIAIIAASTALGALVLLLLCMYYGKYKKRSQNKHEKSSWDMTSFGKRPITVMDYNYKTLEAATNNFGESNMLGVGGFGSVYRGKLEENHCVAVKKLSGGNVDTTKEFQTEVEILSRIQHPNIISLLGYSAHAETRLLVYELMQQGSLEAQLHGPSKGSALTWHSRMKIALDTARGLEYLHVHCHPPVIHRDLKSANILLDSNFTAKLSDFGLSVVDGYQNKNDTKLSGTLGYVAPEYLLDGKLTDKSDVYAFGVVLLELLLGRKPLEKLAPPQCQSIVTWAMPQLTDRKKLPSIVDPVIKNSMDLKHLFQVAAVAVLCVQPEPSYRPLITDIVHSLVPLVPFESGGTLKITDAADTSG